MSPTTPSPSAPQENSRSREIERRLAVPVLVSALVSVPAVLFALGPAQVLRLLRVVGTLHLLRVTRIVQAGGMLRRRLGLTGRWGTAVTVTTTLLAAVFVTAILADPGSASRRVLDDTIDVYGWWPTAAAIALTLGATAVVVLHRWGRLRELRSPGGHAPARSTGSPEPPEDGEPPEPVPQSSP